MGPCEALNFCRVFELPTTFPRDFCFADGHDVTFKLVDWFNPIPAEDVLENKIKPWNEYKQLLVRFLKDKPYIKPDRSYILITDFGESLVLHYSS